MNRTKTFLEELSVEIMARHPEGMEGLRIVFPNRRAGLFFNKALAKLITKPVWSPTVQSIEDFILGFSAFEQADRLTLLLDLYGVFREVFRSGETFEHFYFWGEMLLKDFDEADKYLVNSADLFVTLKNLKEIDSRFHFFSDEQKEAVTSFWSAALGNPGQNKKDFLAFWQSLGKVHKHFINKLEESGYAYQGMIYRHVWHKMEQNQVDLANNKVIFAGFNALTLVEEHIIKWVIAEKGGKIFWDVDAHYFDDPVHEAGHFLRKYYQDPVFRSSFPSGFPNRFRNNEKSVRVISSSQYTGQVKIAGNLINELADTREQDFPEDTVIVLPDETLLSLLLYAIPDRIGKLNITMGYPVTASTFYSLFEHLLELQEKARSGGKIKWFNHANVIDILNHPYLRDIDEATGKEIATLIRRNNMILIPDTLFGKASGLRKIFRAVEQAGDLFDYLMEILVLIRDHFPPVGDGGLLFEREVAVVLYKFFNRLKATFAASDVALSCGMVRKVIRSYVRTERIPFTGEPLEGLQIMGLMETRNLDFRNVILLGVNEGFLPGSATHSSFIPHNVRRAFGLPVPENQEAIYSYLFYSLIQRAEKVFLIYNSEDAYNRKAEPSRYIYQLNFETGLILDQRMLVNDISISERPPMVIRKDVTVMNRLDRYLVHSDVEPKFLTPSKLSTYLGCPLNFCYRYVYDVEEKQEVTEDLDAAKFGNILHQVMEYLYQPFLGRRLGADDFRLIANGIDEAIARSFADYHGFEKNSVEFRFEGKNLLGREILRKYVKKILEYDQSQGPFVIHGLEVGYQLEYPIEIAGVIKPVRLRGNIDRLDEKDGTLRIIDYKTGRDLSSFGSVSELYDRSGKNRNKAVFQTFLYALMFLMENPGNDLPVVTGLYNFKELHTDGFDIRIKLKSGRGQPAEPLADIRPMMGEFRENFENLLREIFDPAVPFAHSPDIKDCFYCRSLGAPSEFSLTFTT